MKTRKLLATALLATVVLSGCAKPLTQDNGKAYKVTAQEAFETAVEGVESMGFVVQESVKGSYLKAGLPFNPARFFLKGKGETITIAIFETESGCIVSVRSERSKIGMMWQQNYEDNVYRYLDEHLSSASDNETQIN